MHPAVAEPYVQFLVNLTPASVAEVGRYCAADMRFRDPFHDIRGVDEYRRVLGAMYEAMDVDEFRTTSPVCADNQCHFEWTLRYRFRNPVLPRDTATIFGATRLRFDKDGRVAEHFDYWDSSDIFERVPALGSILRALKRRIAGT